MKYSWIAVLAFITLVCCARKEDKGVSTLPEQWEEEEVMAPTREISDLPESGLVNNNAILSEAFNDSNYVQYAVAERLGIDPMSTLGYTYNTKRPIVKVESGDHYLVDKLTHSMPFLVPEAAALLEEIGTDFTELARRKSGEEGYRIVVTSLLRSPYTVKKLRRVNRNATDSSTHMFGTTFDISWSHFDSRDTIRQLSNEQLKMLLANILLQKRKEGKCLVKYEIKSPCFHITAAR